MTGHIVSHSFRLPATLTALLLAAASAQAQVTAEKLRWKGGAKAAWSYIHDDYCGDTPGIGKNADPESHKRGLVFAAGAIVGGCGGKYEEMNRLISHGHEIISHSWSHADARKGWNAAREIGEGKTTLEKNMVGQKEVTYFIFPFDSYNDAAITALKAAGFISFRGAKTSYQDRGLTKNMDTFTNWGATYFEVYMGRNFAAMKKHLDDAIAAGGWANQEMHGVGDGSWEPFPLPEYQAHLDYGKSLVDKGDLWNAGPTAVVRYAMTYNQSGAPTVSGNTLAFPSANIGEKLDHPISVKLTIPSNPAGLTAQQGSSFLSVSKAPDGKFIVDVNPKLGPVTLNFGATVINPRFAEGNRFAPFAAAPTPSRTALGRAAGAKALSTGFYAGSEGKPLILIDGN